MAWTKRQIVEHALDEIGIASYNFDYQPEELQTAMQRLDLMMATWNAKGIRVSYNMPSSAISGLLDDDSGLPDSAIEAVVLNLACRIAPSYGKQISQDTRKDAKSAYNAMIGKNISIPQVQLPGDIPAGAGNNHGYGIYNRYLRQPVDNLQAGSDSDLELQ